MHKIKVRWVIQQKNTIFLVRDPYKHFYYLPGGTLEDDENFKECLDREIREELWVKPLIWSLLSIQEFPTNNGLYLDIWFETRNWEDFQKIKKDTTSHGFEYYDEWFYTFDELIGKDVRPINIQEILHQTPYIKTIL